MRDDRAEPRPENLFDFLHLHTVVSNGHCSRVQTTVYRYAMYASNLPELESVQDRHLLVVLELRQPPDRDYT